MEHLWYLFVSVSWIGIGSRNDFAPVQHQFCNGYVKIQPIFYWACAYLLMLGLNILIYRQLVDYKQISVTFESRIKSHIASVTKMYLKMSVKWWPFRSSPTSALMVFILQLIQGTWWFWRHFWLHVLSRRAIKLDKKAMMHSMNTL